MMNKLSVAIVLTLGLFLSCKDQKKQVETKESLSEQIVADTLKWSERMALSEIERFPDPTLLDFREKPRWSYTNGLVLQAMSRVYEQTHNQKLYDYIYDYGNRMIHEDGSIETYKISNYNLDMIKSGDAIYYLYQNKQEPRFKQAMDTLHKQLEGQPTTSEGGYWHKKVYPFQMWLDGVYMAEPFHTKYAKTFMSPEEAKKVYDKIMLQFDLIEKHSRDSETGLYYHGWDESKEQKWANKETGLSQHFWSRGMGWYGMAMVDVLDVLPEDYEGRDRLLTYLNQYAEAIVKFQDESGAWYQVLNLPDREGNYLEATGTSMFTYTLAKGVNKGYLPESFKAYADKGFQGILDTFITVEDSGVVNLNQCCSVAGLGGNPYRDGTFEYYIGEKIRSNDPKGTGPFIMAALELGK
ncbi:glycoside hydrolase family 88 protein [Mangrovimonas sp. AS39]|uniref:glycoside hydrolase family 88/105 protein n=1 Tax=Mangrovimonas futianensis TaxID=2895523 RepID=UPI001E3EE839|nr:glycoside hydrolase family 88 protein [Mangrovimonas futianensis]MCF1190987.1 glycoside hydrolase family 88 protein [Mangrovimonas futianensis]MCF1194683.1 glycoside hydrolase family 88 protein [Mangrovimonas futianensis]